MPSLLFVHHVLGSCARVDVRRSHTPFVGLNVMAMLGFQIKRTSLTENNEELMHKFFKIYFPVSSRTQGELYIQGQNYTHELLGVVPKGWIETNMVTLT